MEERDTNRGLCSSRTGHYVVGVGVGWLCDHLKKKFHPQRPPLTPQPPQTELSTNQTDTGCHQRNANHNHPKASSFLCSSISGHAGVVDSCKFVMAVGQLTLDRTVSQLGISAGWMDGPSLPPAICAKMCNDNSGTPSFHHGHGKLQDGKGMSGILPECDSPVSAAIVGGGEGVSIQLPFWAQHHARKRHAIPGRCRGDLGSGVTPFFQHTIAGVEQCLHLDQDIVGSTC